MSQKQKNDYSSEPLWYVVHTYSGYENKVKTDLEKTLQNRDLQDYIFKIVIPMEEQIEIKKGKTKKNLRKVFPGYVLIKMIVTEETWYIVRNTPGVTGFVGSGTETTPVSDAEIKKIKKRMGVEEPKHQIDFEEGEVVSVIDGPFKGFDGTISEIDTVKGKIKVMVSMFGRDTPVELDALQVKKI